MPRADTNASAPRVSRRPRGSLSPDEILDGAEHLVGTRGLDALSMPTLARQLRSGVSSIYWYFRSKDDLVEALTDRVSRAAYEGLPPIGAKPWDEELFDYFAAFRDLIERSPVYRELFAYRVRFLFDRAAMAPTMLRRLEDGLRLLVAGGVPRAVAIEAMQACSNYTRGFVLLERGIDLPHSGHDDPIPVGIGVERHPLLDQSVFDQLTRLDGDQFTTGLRLLIDGVRRRVETG